MNTLNSNINLYVKLEIYNNIRKNNIPRHKFKQKRVQELNSENEKIPTDRN